YVELMRQARIQMTQEGDYDPRMMKLLKRVRCTQGQAAECALKDE
ncbi:MAG: putative solute-binding protein, partial [Paraperlucidibaca sp.]